jgi:hypothetical protein
MSTQFAFSNIQYMEHGTPARRIGIHSADVSCTCGHRWTTSTANGLYGMVGAMRVPCPACQVVENVPRATLGF